MDAHLGQMAGHHNGVMYRCIVLVQVPLPRLEVEFWPLATKSLPELSQNLYAAFFVDRLARRNPVDVDHALAVEKRDHHELLGGFALPGLLGSVGASMRPLSALSHAFWVITVDPAFITGYQRVEYAWI